MGNNGDDRLYGELSRVNNELINAQRELVQRNVLLERAEDSLRKAHGGLEQQVQERTRELEGTVKAFQAEVAVRRATEQKLRALSLTVLRLQDEERRRVARDLHDTAGQSLTALKLTLSALEKKIPRDAANAELFADLNSLVDQALQEIRTTSHLLHPPLLDESGFASAATWYVEGFNKRSPIQVKLQLPDSFRLSSHIEIVLFRVLQESLTNITKHSGSTTVDVLLAVSPDVITLSIKDYGRGISSGRLKRMNDTGSDVGVGIAGMRERLRELGGNLDIQSDSSGTVVRASIPTCEIL